MPLILYSHPLASFCWKVLIALYEAGTPFEAELVDLGDPEGRAAFLKISPMGKMPALRDGDGVVLETSLIVEHLARSRPEAAFLLPEDPATAPEVRYWDRFFDLYVQAPMQRIVADRLRPPGARDPFGVEQARAELRTAYDVAEARMAGRTWAAGEGFSMADCAAAPGLYYGDKVSPFTATHPTLAAYLGRLKARPSFARVLQEAEPYAHLFPREPEPA